MKVGSLFAGIGGFDLGLERAGFEIAWQVENDPWCQKILKKHWPEVPKYGDIRECRGENVADSTGPGLSNRRRSQVANAREKKSQSQRRSGFSDGLQNGKSEQRIYKHILAPVDLVCGGFPCQPFSHAGKRGGKADDRYLWPEMLRVIAELKPAWVVGENVAGIANMGEQMGPVEMESRTLVRTPESDFYEAVCIREELLLLYGIIKDLEEIGYRAIPVDIPACALNADHKRHRIWIVAHRDDGRHDHGEWAQAEQGGHGQEDGLSQQASQDVPDTKGARAMPTEQREQWDGIEPHSQDAPHYDPDRRTRSSVYERSRCEGQGAPHIGWDCEDVADTEVKPERAGLCEGRKGKKRRRRPCDGSGEGDAPYTDDTGRIEQCGTFAVRAEQFAAECRGWWESEPDVGRVAHGVPNRVDRLRGLGNAVVPQIPEIIGRAIMDIENG